MPQTQWSQMGRWHAWQYFQYSQRHSADNCSQTGFLCSVKIYWIFQLQGHLKSITKKIYFYFTLLDREMCYPHCVSCKEISSNMLVPAWVWPKFYSLRLYIVKSLVKKSNIRKTIDLAVMMKKLNKHSTGHTPVPLNPESRGERYLIRTFPSELWEPSKSYYR